LLKQAAIKRDVKVRILTTEDYNIEGTHTNSEMLEEKENQINFQCFKLVSQTENTTFLIIDRKFSLAVPSSVMIKSSEKSSIATTTYSNEEAVALSYASVFDNI
jgi:hypothetical protein